MAAGLQPLDHFYFGQLARPGEPPSELRLLARSPGVSPEQAATMTRVALLPPLTGSPAGAWAVVRTPGGGFALVQSQRNERAAVVLHLVLLPAELLRALAGNLVALRALLDTTAPVYESAGAELRPLWIAPSAPGPDDQTDLMLALMTCTGNRLGAVEKLLATLIHGRPLVVRGAPPDLDARLALVAGLLALLPPPARYGITFALHALPASRVDAQVRFVDGELAPGTTIVYDWASGQLEGDVPADDYSRFILSQLRLDTQVVVEQTEALARVAAWRLKQGDTLASALAYGSNRLATDRALLNGLPVAAEEAARILLGDPTLDADLRAAYMRHVLAFALALENLALLEPLVPLLRQQPALETAMLEALEAELTTPRAAFVYTLVATWLQRADGPAGMQWTALLEAGALAQARQLAQAGQPRRLAQLIGVLAAGAAREGTFAAVLQDVFDAALPAGSSDPELAGALLQLAARYLPPEYVRRAVEQSALQPVVGPAPVAVLDALDRPDEPAPPGLLVRAATSFPDPLAALLLVRLTELALLDRRLDLIDAPALAGLAQAALLPDVARYDGLLRAVARAQAAPARLLELGESGAQSVLRLLLARRAYAELAQELMRPGGLGAAAERSGDLPALVRRLFLETPLRPDEARDALHALGSAGMKALPVAMGYLGALKRGNWGDAVHPLAADVTELLYTNRLAATALPPAALVELLEYHVKRRDLQESLRVAGLFPLVAAERQDAGVQLVAQMARMLDWDRSARSAAVEVLRRYVRQVDGDFARNAVVRLGEHLGEPVLPVLEAAYALRELCHGEPLDVYADWLNRAARFLRESARVFVQRGSTPGLPQLNTDVDALRAHLTSQERTRLADLVLAIGQSVAVLAGTERHARERDVEARTAELLEGRGALRSGLDVLRGTGGYVARGRRLRLDFANGSGLYLLRERTASDLMTDVEVTERILGDLLRVFPPDRPVPFGVDALRSDFESLWTDVSAADRRRIAPDLAADLQAIPDLVLLIGKSGDIRALESGSGLGRKLDSGRQRPASTLEFFRFLHGAFKGPTQA